MQPAKRGGQRGGKDEAAEADDEQKIQRQVEVCLLLQCACLTDAFDAQHCGKQQEGQQADENHTPAKIADYQAAERRADCRRHGGDERGYANHEAETFAGNLLQDNVEHQGQSDACADALQQASGEQHIKAGRPR